MTIVAATDGSALGNPGPAGWAWYIDEQRWAAGGWAHGTNNMGELTAVLQLLQATAESTEDLHVYCDSVYVINTITKWMAGWKAKGWRKKDGKPPENLQIVKDLDAAMVGRRVRFEWVKGHAGHPLNEQADARATAAAAAFQAGTAPAVGPGFGEPNGAADHPDLFSTLEDGLLDGGPAPTSADLVATLEAELLQDTMSEDPARLAALLHPQWREITATGRLVTRDDVLAAGAVSSAASLEVVDSVEFDDGRILLVCRTLTRSGARLHSALWVRERDQWRQIFRQMTPETA